MPQPLPLFPSDNWWNLDISQAPLDPNSANFINFIGVNRQLHPDWGGSAFDAGNPFAIYGMNAIAVFVLSGILGRLIQEKPIMDAVFTPIASPKNASLMFAVANVLLLYLIAWIMYRRRWFLRF